MSKTITVGQALAYCMDKDRIRNIRTVEGNLKQYKFLQESRLIFEKTGTLQPARMERVLNCFGFGSLLVEVPKGVRIPAKQ